MANLSLKHIYKVYPNGTKAVNDFTMDIEDKEFIVFVGPSGCGKSTTLRMIAGLEEITAGELTIGDVVVNDEEPKERDIAMVFQNYALYPHMSIFDNIAFGLKMRKMPKDQIKQKVEEAAQILGITEYLNKKPKEMSGGQRQRVALGRAIVRNPKVMLLDEPLSNLDAKLRTAMRSEIVKLHEKLGTTFIYVTHDQVEAMTMGTRIVVMKDGFIKQIDTPQNLYLYPDNKFVAGFIGTPQMNFLEGELSFKDDKGYLKLDKTGQIIELTDSIMVKVNPEYLDKITRVTLGVRPEDVTFYKESEKHYHKIKLLVNHNEELGTETLVYTNLYCENPEITDVPNLIVKSKPFNSLTPNKEYDAFIDLDKIHLFDSETEENIIPRVPKNNYLSAKINLKDNIITTLGQKTIIPTSVKLTEGDCKLIVPLKAIISGDKYEGKIITSEKINNKYLYMIECKNEKLFVLKDEQILDKTIKFNIDFKYVDYKYSDQLINHLELNNFIDSKFALIKEKGIDAKTNKKKILSNYYYEMLGTKFLATSELQRKMFNAYEDRKVFHKIFECEISPYDVQVAENGVEVLVKSVIKFEDEEFLACEYNQQMIYVSKDISSNVNVNDTIYLDINIENMSVTEKERKIKIV